VEASLIEGLNILNPDLTLPFGSQLSAGLIYVPALFTRARVLQEDLSSLMTSWAQVTCLDVRNRYTFMIYLSHQVLLSPVPT